MEYKRAHAVLDIKTVGDDEDYVYLSGTASSITPDRVGDSMNPLGAKFRLPMPFLAQHDSDRPIGEVTEVEAKDDKIKYHARLPKKTGLDYVDTEIKKIKHRLVKGASIGFRIIKSKFNGKGLDIHEWDWMELSAVTIPANADADIATVKRYDAVRSGGRYTRASEGKSASPQTASNRPAKKSSSSAPTRDNCQMTTIADRIAAKQDRQIAIKDRMNELKSLIEADDTYEFSDEEQAEIDTLTAESDAVTKSIESLQLVEAKLSEKAQPVRRTAAGGDGNNARYPQPGGDPANSEKDIELIWKTATAHFVAFAQHKPPEYVASEIYKGDDRIVAVVKTGVEGADTTTVGWATELVQTAIQGFMDLLAPVSVYAALRSRGSVYSFGNNTSITVPRRTGASRMPGAFVGEQGVIPVKAGSLGSMTLNQYKMAVISVFSKELSRSSIPAIEQVIRQAILDDTALTLDGYYLDALAAVAGIRPAGIRNGVVPTASAGTTTANIITDLKALLQPMMNNNAGRRPIILMNTAQRMSLATVTLATGGFLFRDEIASGRILGVEFISSTNVPAGTMIALDAPDMAFALGTPEFEVSDTTSLVMANADGTAPTQADDGAGALGTAEQVPPDGGINIAQQTAPGAAAAGYVAQSMFQTYQTAIRMVLPTCWGVARPGNIAVVNNIAW